MAGIFKAYDIRGKADDITEDIAYKVGVACCQLLQKEEKKIHVEIVVSHDMRETSPQIYDACLKGIIDQGGKALVMGLASTPMNYFAVGHLKADGGIQITASHNPREYNGIKICRKGAVSMHYQSGLQIIEDYVEKTKTPKLNHKQGTKKEISIAKEYMQLICKYCQSEEPIKIVIDAGNGMAGLEVPWFEANFLHVEIIPMYFTLDGSFPNHEANPSKDETLSELRDRVVQEKADFGVAFDGDADRIRFVDEKGEIVANDLIATLLGAWRIKKNHDKGTILYDLRSSKILPETIQEAGGKPIMTRVGHSYIQELMHQHKAIFGSELSGHFYYSEFFNCDAALLTLAHMISLMGESEETLSEHIKPYKKYFASGEINFNVKNAKETLIKLREKYADIYDTDIDGLKFVGDKFWFVIRPSNTEPVVRLTVEASDPKTLEKMVKEISEHIQ
jgi:phosphomannomutase